MRTFHSARLGQTCLFFAVLLAAAAPMAAFTVDNRTPYDIRVRVPQASEAGWDNDDGEEVPANTFEVCDWTDVNCSSATEDGDRRRQLPLSATVLIEGSFGDMSEGKGLFTCTLPLLADGVLVVDVQERNYLNGTAVPYAPNVICTARFREDVAQPGFAPGPCIDPVIGDQLRGSLICPDVDVNGDGVYSTSGMSLHWTDPYSAGRRPDSLPEMRTANREDLQFYVTGDPQFDNGSLDEGETGFEEKTLDGARMMDALIRSAGRLDQPEVRGVIVSGDLTQNARAQGSVAGVSFGGDELGAYLSSIRFAPWFGFEGLGNHDVEPGDDEFPISLNNPQGMIEFIAEKARGTIPTNRRDKENNQAPNYSWDWHDVHFVQLNVAPANGFIDPDGPDGDTVPLMMRDALAFLQADLALNVGSTGRPVVLFHHYGFDSFSTDGWWADVHRRDYWNAIANYNVIGIFTGHRHYTRTGTSWRNPFVKPASTIDRPDGRTEIPAYVAGAALGGDSTTNDGVALHVEINECNEMIIRRVGEGPSGIEPASGTLDDEETVTFTTTGWGDPATTCAGTLTPQTISFPPLSDVTYGAPDVPLAATASSGLPVSYSSTGSCSVVGSTAVINGAGLCTVTASQPGDASWEPALDVMQSFTVFRAVPTVVATGGTFEYDGGPHPATGTVTGVFGEDLGAPTMTYTPGGAAAPVSVGTYDVLASFAGNANYEIAEDAASITITPIALSAAITAADKVYDSTVAATILTRTLVGVLPGDDVTLLGGTATFDNKNVGAGKTVTGSGFTLGGAQAGNYSLPAGATAVTTADISPAPLSVEITAANKVYDGTTVATILTRTPVGVFSGDTVTVEGGTATFADPNVANGILVTGSGFTLGGADGPNYFLPDGTTAVTAADITPAQTTTGVISSLNPSTFGQNVVFTATVAPIAPGGGVPLGSVQFAIDGAPVATVALSGGQATFSTALLGAGLHVVQANYLGHLNHTSSSGSLAGGQQVLPFAVTGTVSVSPDTQQYSDEVTFSLSLPNPSVNGQSPLTAGSTGTFVLGSPDQTMGTCTLAAGAPMACTLANEPLLETVAGAMAAGAHSASISFPPAAFNPNYAVTLTPGGLTIQHEDATITPDASNPSAVLVATEGGSSPEFSLVAEIQELADGSLGDISLAELSCTLSPVGPGGGSSVDGVLNLSGPPAPGGPVTATCTFPAGVEVNVYSVDYQIGGNYYTGSAQETLTVYDPSLGFATGGGWFYWPGTEDGAYPGDKTNFGFHLKFNKKGKNVQGGLLVIRHRADGTIVRLKSNAMDGFAIGDEGNLGWATANGKATYINQQTMTDAVGNQQFLFYAEDHDEPGTGVDRFWVQAPTTDGELSLPSEAAAKAVEISGGNIAIPHGTGGRGPKK